MTEKVLKVYQEHIGAFTLHPSSGGVFEVTLGDEVVFSKKALGRFPEDGEIEAIISDKLAG